MPLQAGKSATAASWQAIRDTMMMRIRSRYYLPGELIPNEATLATEFGCARATVNRALRDLAASGFLDRRRKAGTRVMEAPRRRATLDIPLTRDEVESRGHAYEYRLLLHKIEPPPREVAAPLRLRGEPELLHVQSLHLADGRPHLFEDRWVVLETVPAIAEARLDMVSANEWLLREAPYTHGTMEFHASAAGPAGRHLGCDPGTAVMSMIRMTWMQEAPITHARQVFAPDYRLHLNL